MLPSEVIMRLDSAVGQLDYLQNKLVVSTSTKTYLCDTMKQQFTGIGKKPRYFTLSMLRLLSFKAQ